MDKVYFTWKDFDDAVVRIEGLLRSRGLLGRFDNIHGVPRGGLILAVALSHRLSKPLATAFTLATGKHTLLVDDISDSGKTLEVVGEYAACTAVIHLVEGTTFVPSVYALKKPKDKWVVYPWEEVHCGSKQG